MQLNKIFGRAVIFGVAGFALACGEDPIVGTGSRLSASGSINATIDGVAFNGNQDMKGFFGGTNKQLRIEARSADGRGIQLIVTNVEGAGTYQVTLGGATFGSTSSGITSLWMSNLIGGSGSIVIEEADRTGAKGTFSFVALPSPGSTAASGPKTVTNGRFDVEYDSQR